MPKLTLAGVEVEITDEVYAKLKGQAENLDHMRVAHPNDTLHGKLFAYEIEDQKHLRSKVGYWRMVEERMIRQQIAEEGGDIHDIFEVGRRVVSNHKADMSYKEYQDGYLKPLWRAQSDAAFARGETERGIQFNKAELEHLFEHFMMSNDPVALSIFEKARRALGDDNSV